MLDVTYRQMHNVPKRQSLHAFSLIELLAAIAIIAILAALLINGINAIRIRTDRTASASNLRQIGQAITLYANDHGGALPDVQGTAASVNTYWWSYVSTYLGAPEAADSWGDLIKIPVLRSPYQSEKIAEYTGMGWLGRAPSFAMNYCLGRSIANPLSLEGNPIRLSQIPSPSETLLASEAGFSSSSMSAMLTPVYMRAAAREIRGDGLEETGGAIQGVSHMLWVDGHVTSTDDVRKYTHSPYTRGEVKDIWSPGL
ncbi:MAG: prepilin-type N-terminal cleavage/methylation domain-containing protein [Verrucomicrobiota bacterium JB024]|nr:prepilin-type N-terminal cleavage/methylation domain-containing protein [Verrucomicrobiota bacterium JB024]